MSAGKELKLTPEQIANWFGNRGYDLFSYEQTDRPLTYKAVTKNGENWLFILDDWMEYEGCNEVESYCLDSDCCEAYDGFPMQNFDWSVENLLSNVVAA